MFQEVCGIYYTVKWVPGNEKQLRSPGLATIPRSFRMSKIMFQCRVQLRLMWSHHGCERHANTGFSSIYLFIFPGHNDCTTQVLTREKKGENLVHKFPESQNISIDPLGLLIQYV